MQHTPITSSNIKSIAHEDNRLEIAFLDGKLYEYLGVPTALFEQFFAAESKGKFFHMHIKDKFQFRRLK